MGAASETCSRNHCTRRAVRPARNQLYGWIRAAPNRAPTPRRYFSHARPGARGTTVTKVTFTDSYTLTMQRGSVDVVVQTSGPPTTASEVNKAIQSELFVVFDFACEAKELLPNWKRGDGLRLRSSVKAGPRRQSPIFWMSTR